MAGIGFELKKLFSKEGFFNLIKAYLYSTLVTVGPFILCTSMIITIQIILKYLNMDFLEREIFLATVVYAFIFSQIITSGFSMVITRYVADRLYEKEFEEILPSLYGIISICIAIGGAIGIIFLYRSSMGWKLALASYLLYIQLIIMWLETVYLTALKDYIKIFKSYVLGVIISIVLSYWVLKTSNYKSALGLLMAMDMGIFIIITFLMAYIKSFFKSTNNTYYGFLTYMDKYPELFLVNFFYTLSLYIHNFIFWNSHMSVTIVDTYKYCPTYDVPTFYAFLSIIPAMVIFVVSVETSFYNKYREYYSLITGGGNLSEIENAKNNMERVLWEEVRNLMEVQIFFSLIGIILGNIFLPRLGLNHLSIDIFNILVLGAYGNIIFLITILLQLYFEDRIGALVVSSVFIITNTLFTLDSLKLGENFYGLGFFLSAFTSLIISLMRLAYFLDNINYYTFCSQPIIYREREGIFHKILKFFGHINEKEK
ncbi:exopolysaccharide Pel transporter PelG [Anaeromicrobium sediminis]|uniref:Exopolysaccharide Pel transporter PelG n=1 Tax=Anaeromicrobium sediminis TaxID=1478221 RepID=A0A267MEC7_9FIRM|nr:exopolysaccharide Pel transporter PelG [Anaeromicrobium sediminis]PAB57752.1 hypothetical protein CCE28_18185 [Anaeromicrobium sediminis]